MNPSGVHPKILVLPRPSIYRQLFSTQSDALLRSLGDVAFHNDERNPTSADLAERIGDFDIVISGWGSPKFTDEVLSAATKLKLIAHSAGSIRFMLDDHAIGNGFEISTVAIAMGPTVAEMTLLFAMLLLRKVHEQDRDMKAGVTWETVKTGGMGEEIAGQRIGIIGAGHVGRAVIDLLTRVGAQIVVFDPYLPDAVARELGAEKVGTLEELLSTCRIVSQHAPATPQTHRMLGKREFALLRDGAMLINTGRSYTVDEDALLAELQSGRISAAIDVFDQEPLPVEHPFRKLKNVIITPHLGAATVQCRLRQGRLTVEEVQRFCRGEPLKFAVTRAMYATMA